MSDVRFLLLSVLFPVVLLGAEGPSAPPEFKALPASLRQRASVVFAARFIPKRGAIYRDGMEILLRGRAGTLRVTATYSGLAPEDMPVDPETLPKSKFIDAEPKSSSTYLVLLDHEQILLALVYLPPRAERVDIVDFGRFQRETEEPRRDAPHTSSGYVNVVDAETTPKVVERTNHIEATVGLTLGLLFRAEGPVADFGETAPIHIRVLHPPTTNRETGKVSSREEWDAPANIGIIRFTGWTFDTPGEVVPGTWTIEILQDGVVLARKEFTITTPASK